MIINYASFVYDEINNQVNVQLKDIGSFDVKSADNELMKKERINIHDLKYYEFRISDMTTYDFALSSRNQVTVPIRFLSKLGVLNKDLISIAASDIGEDFYRFLVNVKNIELSYELMNVTDYCEEFLSNLDGFRLVDNSHKDRNNATVSQGIFMYLGDFLHHINEEVIRDRIASNANDKKDFDIVKDIVNLMSVEGNKFESINFSPIKFSSNERLLLKQYNNIEISKKIISQLPSELDLGISAADSYSMIDMRDTMLIRLLRLHYGSVNIRFEGFFNTNDIKFKIDATDQHVYGLKSIKSIISNKYPEADTHDIFDKFLPHNYDINYCKCHDFIVIIKSLNYGFLHNLLGMRYLLLSDIVINEMSSDKSFIERVTIKAGERLMEMNSDRIQFKGFTFNIEENYYIANNDNNIIVEEVLPNF